MTNHARSLWSGAAISIACLAAAARAQEPLAALRAMYPEVRTHSTGKGVLYIHGAEMTPGLTEADAAATFLSHHGRVFGDRESDLETWPEWSMPSGDGQSAIFAYRQRIRGKEVDGSAIRLEVRRGPMWRVDYAAARVAADPTMGREIPLVPASVAAALVQVQRGYGALTIVGEPEVVVLRGDGARPDAWCWRVRAAGGQSPVVRERVFYVDTAMPRVLHVRDSFWSLGPPTTGRVEARGMPAAYPFLPYQGSSSPLVLHRIPGLSINASVTGAMGTGQAFTNDTGNFSLRLGQSGQTLTLKTTLGQTNQWYQVYGFAAPVYLLSASSQCTVGDQLALELVNAELSEEFRVAQTDTVVTANRGRAFFLRYISATAPGLTYPLSIIPNSGGTLCNAGAAAQQNAFAILFSPSNAALGCWNFGSHSAAAHEYGHIALAMLGQYANAFHEGYADSFANMLNDDSVQGRAHYMDGRSVRDDPTSTGINCQYPLPANSSSPCDCGKPHAAGQLLSGPWVRIRNALKSSYGNATGLEHARVMFGTWSLMTLGGDEPCGSANPGTLIEVLAAARNPAQRSIICNAFASHGIVCAGCCQ